MSDDAVASAELCDGIVEGPCWSAWLLLACAAARACLTTFVSSRVAIRRHILRHDNILRRRKYRAHDCSRQLVKNGVKNRDLHTDQACGGLT